MHRAKHGAKFYLGILVVLAIAVSSVLYLIRSDHCMLYYYGASPGEVPQGTAIAFFNPLRNRKDEANAESLIRDLRTDKCDEISRERLGADAARMCQVMRDNTKASLIWLDPESNTMKGGTRQLIYDLPDKKARLIVYFGVDERGWGVKSASVVR